MARSALARKAGLEVGEDALLGNAERLDRRLHAARSGSKMPAISASGCSATCRSRSPMCMWSKLMPSTPCFATPSTLPVGRAFCQHAYATGYENFTTAKNGNALRKRRAGGYLVAIEHRHVREV